MGNGLLLSYYRFVVRIVSRCESVLKTLLNHGVEISLSQCRILVCRMGVNEWSATDALMDSAVSPSLNAEPVAKTKVV